SGGGSLSELLQASRWFLRVGAPADDLERAVAAFLAADEVAVERMTKKGLRSFDARAAVSSLAVVEQSGGPAIELVLRHVEPLVRPDDVLAGLTRLGDLELTGASLLT